MPEQGTHFWFMTFTSTGGAKSFAGTTIPNEATRLDMYGVIHEQIVKSNPDVAGAAVIAFDIQPNKL